MEMVDILRPFPVNRGMIVGTDYENSRYLFATSQAQLLREKALSRSGRDIVQDDQETEDYGPEDFGFLDNEEAELVDAYTQRISVADDNWKIKMYVH